MNEEAFLLLRQAMMEEIAAEAQFVGEQTGRASFKDDVMQVIGRTPRHEFVPVELQAFSYMNTPLPIGYGKTISQPFIVALMTDLLDIEEDDVVLEIGTGLGYQAAILAQLAKKVYSIELLEELASQAKIRLGRQGFHNIELKRANGYSGWPQHAPYDKMIVTAAPDLIPPALINQLKPGGRMMIPAGMPDSQQLILVEKALDGRISTSEILPVRFSQLEEDGMAREGIGLV